jgi:hypothetical protein
LLLYQKRYNGCITDKIGELSDAQKAEQEKLLSKARDIIESHYQFCREVIYSEIPVFLKDDTYQIHHAVSNVMALRGAVLEEALKTAYISYAENDERRMLGAYLYL